MGGCTDPCTNSCGEGGTKLAAILSKNYGKERRTGSRNRVCILWRLPVMPVTSSILSSAETEREGRLLQCCCGGQGIFSFPYPVIISSSTSPPPPPPTLQMKIFVAGGLRVKTPMITLDGTDTGRHGIRKKRFKTRQNPDMNSGGKVGTSASALGTSLSVGRPRWISPFSILSETVARQKEGMERRVGPPHIALTDQRPMGG